MTFLEFFNLDKGAGKSLSVDVGSLSNDKRLHRHQKGLYAINQIGGKTKKPNGVARYLIKKDDEINQCIRTGKDIPLNTARAEFYKNKYGLIPTKQEPEKAIKQTNVYLIMNPNGSYILRFKGEKHGESKIFR